MTHGAAPTARETSAGGASDCRTAPTPSTRSCCSKNGLSLTEERLAVLPDGASRAGGRRGLNSCRTGKEKADSSIRRHPSRRRNRSPRSQGRRRCTERGPRRCRGIRASGHQFERTRALRSGGCQAAQVVERAPGVTALRPASPDARVRASPGRSGRCWTGRCGAARSRCGRPIRPRARPRQAAADRSRRP